MQIFRKKINCKNVLINLVALFSVIFSLTSLAYAKVCNDKICFSEDIKRKDINLQLVGSANFTYFYIDVYSGAFYSDANVVDEKSVFDVSKPKHLVLVYKRNIRKEDFIESSKKLLLNNKTINHQSLEAKFNKVFEAFESVQPGDKYSLDYYPEDVRTCLSLNGVEKMCEYGEDFQKAFFGIWLSSYSVGQDFTQGLLGKK